MQDGKLKKIQIEHEQQINKCTSSNSNPSQTKRISSGPLPRIMFKKRSQESYFKQQQDTQTQDIISDYLTKPTNKESNSS